MSEISKKFLKFSVGYVVLFQFCPFLSGKS